MHTAESDVIIEFKALSLKRPRRKSDEAGMVGGGWTRWLHFAPFSAEEKPRRCIFALKRRTLLPQRALPAMTVSVRPELGEGFIFSEAVRDLYCMLEAYHARVADELFPILSELGDTEAAN